MAALTLAAPHAHALVMGDCDEWVLLVGGLERPAYVDGAVFLSVPVETSSTGYMVVENATTTLGLIAAGRHALSAGTWSTTYTSGSQYMPSTELTIYYGATGVPSEAEKAAWPAADRVVTRTNGESLFACGTGAPEISTSPPLTGKVAHNYVYEASASGGTGTILFSSESRPEGNPGGSELTESGRIRWIPVDFQTGSNPIGLIATDASGFRDIQAFIVEVTNSDNWPPYVRTDDPNYQPPHNANVGSMFSVQVPAVDIDTETEVSFAVEAGPSGVAIDSMGVLTWTPTTADMGSHEITLRLTDGLGASVLHWLTINVLGQPPVWTSVADQTVSQDQKLSLTVVASDPDEGDTVAYALSVAPSSMTIDAVSGLIEWTPGQADVGSHSIRVSATDGTTGFVYTEFTVVVTEVNEAPFFTNEVPPSPTAAETTFVFQLSASDPDLNDTLTFFLVGGPTGMTVSASGLVEWTPTAMDVGHHDFQVGVRDAGGLEATQTYSLGVESTNIPPSLTQGLLANATEEEGYSVRLTATDANSNDSLQFSLVGAPTGMTVNASTGLVSWVPTEAQVAAFDITAVVTDSGGLKDEVTTRVTVANVNDAPEITSVPPGTATQGTAYTYTLAATDRDAGDRLRYEAGNVPTGAAIDVNTGVLNWTPGPEHVGRVSFDVRVVDTASAADSQAFTVEVANVNDPPVFEDQGLDTDAVEGRRYVFQLSATDPDGDALSYTRSAGPQGLTVSATGLVEWTPSSSEGGQSYAVEARVSDGQLEATLSYSISVTNINLPPSLGLIAAQTVEEDQVFTLQLPATDPDAGDSLAFEVEAGPVTSVWDPLTASFVSEPAATVNGTGEFRFEAQQQHVGTHEVRVKVVDAEGLFDRQTFQLTVSNVNDPPLFSSSAPTVVRANQIYRYAAQVTDEDHDPIQYRIVSGPSEMTIGPTTGLVSWLPHTADAGGHVVRIEASDGQLVDQQSFTLTVQTSSVSCSTDPDAARCQALAWAYALHRDGRPLGAVAVDQVGPTSGTRMSDLDSGRVGLGGRAGFYTWGFTSPGFTPVYARATLEGGRVRWVSMPRLAPLTDLAGEVPANATVTFEDPDARVSLRVPAQGLGAASQLSAAILDGQTLPGWLPLGWSVVHGLHMEAETLFSPVATAQLRFPAPLPSGTSQLVWASWDTGALVWRAEEIVSVSQGMDAVTVSLNRGPGSYALLVPDTTPVAVAIPAVDAELSPAMTSSVTSDAAIAGRVEPAQQVASLEAALVTAAAQVTLTRSNPLPSGVVVPAALHEDFLFSDGQRSVVPNADLSVAFYQYPPPSDHAAPSSPGIYESYARFSVRPRFLYTANELARATQTIEVRARPEQSAVPVDASGGQVSDGEVSVEVPNGALADATLVELESLSPDTIQSGGVQASAAFRLEWSGGDATLPLTVSFSPSATMMFLPGRCFVLAREVLGDEGVGWTPIERFIANPSGQLSSAETNYSERLSRLQSGGTFAVFKLGETCPEVVAGAVEREDASRVSGAWVQVHTTRWAGRSEASGEFRLLQGDASSGSSIELTAESPDGLEGRVVLAPTEGAHTGVRLEVRVPSFEVVSVVPPPSTTAPLPGLTRFEVRFGTRLASAALTSSVALKLVHQGTSEVVPGTVLAQADGYGFRLTPDGPLPPGANLTLEVDSNLISQSGSSLQGSLRFDYVTAAAVLRRAGEPQLIAYAPGATVTPCHGFDPNQLPNGFDPAWDSAAVPGFDTTNPQHTCVVGNLGVAEPGAAVLLVNDETGQVSTTVAQPNGSFKGVLSANETDLLSAILENLNGTSIVLELEQQRFDDGSVALYRAGGTIPSAEANPVGTGALELIVEPASIPRRAKFRFTGETIADLEMNQGELAPPVSGTPLMAVEVDYEGGRLEQSLDVRFPIDESLFPNDGIPLNERNFLLAEVVNIDVDGVQVPTYRILDNMDYENGALETHSFPYLGTMIADAVARIKWAVISARYPPPTTGHVAFCPRTYPRCLSEPDKVIEELVADGVVNAPPGQPRLLRGAVVYAGLPSSGGIGVPAVKPGAFTNVTNASGRFSLPVPDGFSTYASHPDFPGVRPVVSRAIPFTSQGAVLGRSAYIVFLDDVVAAAGGPPVVSLSYSPLFPGLHGVSTPPQEASVENRAELVVRAQTARGSEGLTLERPTITSLLATNDATPIRLTDIQLREVPADGSSPPVPEGVVEKRYYITSARPGVVEFEAKAEFLGIRTKQEVTIEFGGSPLPPVLVDAPNPGRDQTAPYVVSPPDSDRTREELVLSSRLEPVVLEFNEAIDRASVVPQTVQVNPPGRGPPVLFLSDDGRRLSITLQPEPETTEVRITMGPPLRDLYGRTFDQNPLVDGEQPYTLKLRLPVPPETASPLGELVNSRVNASVFHGGYMFVADATGNRIVVYDLRTNPIQPTRIGDISFGSQLFFPRDMVIVPRYSYVVPGPCTGVLQSRAQGLNYPPQAGGFVLDREVCEARDRTLLVVMGGQPQSFDVGQGVTGFSGSGAELRIFDISSRTPGAPSPLVVPTRSVASGVIGLSRQSLGLKLEWAPPYLVYLEAGDSFNYVNALNLQNFMFGNRLTQDEALRLPFNSPNGVSNPLVSNIIGVRGLDLNGDGDFADADEFLPLPARSFDSGPPLGYFGKILQTRPQSFEGRFDDYSFRAEDLFVGVVHPRGPAADVPGTVIEPSYDTIGAEHQVGGIQRATTRLALPMAQRFDAIEVFKDLRFRVRTATETASLQGGTLQELDLAVISAWVEDETRLFLIDISDVDRPELLEPQLGLPIPGSEDDTRIGPIKFITLEGDALVLEGSGGELRLSLDRLTMGQPSEGQMHASVVGVAPGMGARQFGQGERSGHGVVLGQIDRTLSFTGPELKIVNFPLAKEVVYPREIGDEASVQAHLEQVGYPEAMALSRFKAVGDFPSDLNPTPESAISRHYHVMVSCPGAAGSELNIQVDVLDVGGAPVGHSAGMRAPVRAMLAGPATQLGLSGSVGSSVIAHRLSDDPLSEFYNTYLSDPIVLIGERVTSTDLDTIRDRNRHVFHSGYGLRVSFDAGGPRSDFLKPYINEVDSSVVPGRIRYGRYAELKTLSMLRAPGPNPEPIAGASSIGTSYGMVRAHSGELVLGRTEFSLPSGRVPLGFSWVYRSQVAHEGVMGPGISFDYDQRLVEVLPGTVSGEYGLVVRDSRERSLVLRAGDVMCHTGTGETRVFYAQGPNIDAPSLAPVVNDPLLSSANLGWRDADVESFYLPEDGYFDVLVKFKDGRWGRVRPDGTRYWYYADGRLDRIESRYDGPTTPNRQELHYEGSRLRWVKDLTYEQRPRWLAFGYYVPKNVVVTAVPPIEGQLTSPTRNLDIQVDRAEGARKIGRLAKVVDFVGRSVRFDYDTEGRLASIEGVRITQAEESGFLGRPKTVFEWFRSGDAMALEALIPPGHNSHLIALRYDAQGRVHRFSSEQGQATVAYTGATEGLAQELSSASTEVMLTFAPPTSPAMNQASTGREIYTFDAYGTPESVALTTGGNDGQELKTQYTFAQGSLLKQIIYPEGNSDIYVYDSGAALLRSRANVLAHRKEVGGAGGGGVLVAQSPSYDPLYNLPTGSHTNLNGVPVTYGFDTQSGCTNCDIGLVSYGGITETFAYDQHGVLTAHQDVSGNQRTVTHTAGITDTITAGSLVTTQIHYTSGNIGVEAELGWPVRVFTPGEPDVTLSCNEEGQVIRERVGLLETHTGYHEDGRVHRIVRDTGGPIPDDEQFKYAPDGFLLSRTALREQGLDKVAINSTWHYSRGPRNSVGAIDGPLVDTLYTRDALGRATETRRSGIVAQREFDKNSKLVKQTVNGDVTEFGYDGHERPIRTTLPGRRSYSTSYTPQRWSFVESEEVSDLSGVSTRSSLSNHDSLGRARAVSNNVSESISLVHRTPATAQASVTGAGIDATYDFDAAGRVTSYEYPNQGYQVDSASSAYKGYKLLDPHIRERGVDRSLSRELDGPTGQTRVVRDQTHRDVVDTPRRWDGTPLSLTTGDVTVTTEHDNVSRSLGRSYASGVDNGVRYDAEGRVIAVGSIQSASRRLFSYHLNSDLLEEVKYADGSHQTLSYNHRGLLNSVRLVGRGGEHFATLGYHFNNEQLGERRISTVGNSIADDVERYTFDALGRPTELTSSSGGRYAIQYLGPYVDRVTINPTPRSGSPAMNFDITCEEDAFGLESLGYPSGVSFNCGLNNERYDDCAVSGSKLFEVRAYDTFAQPRNVKLGGQLQRQDIYDVRGRLSERRYSIDGGASILSYEHTYSNGNRELRRGIAWGTDTPAYDLFLYDGNGRLRWAEYGSSLLRVDSSTVSYPHRPQLPESLVRSSTVTGLYSEGGYGRGFNYRSGNWDEVEDVTFRGEFWPSGFGFPTGTVSATERFLDPFGNVARVENPRFTTLDLVYDGLSRLRRAVRADGVELEYIYRVDGLLQEKIRRCHGVVSCTDGHEVFVYDHRGLLLEIRDGQVINPVIARYYYAAFDGEVPIAMDLREEGGTNMIRYYSLSDRQGSIVGLMGEDGTVVERVAYDTWGAPWVTTSNVQTVAPYASSLGNRLLFQSHLWDPDVDLYFMRARVFDPFRGEFLQRDPSGYADSVNMYAGFAWDPVNLKDPSGEAINGATGLIGCGIGAAGGAAVELFSAWWDDGEVSGSNLVRNAVVGCAVGGVAGLTFGASLGASGGVGGELALASATSGGELSLATGTAGALVTTSGGSTALAVSTGAKTAGLALAAGTGVATGAALATDGGVTALEAASGGASQGSGIIEAVTSGCPGCFVAGTLIALLGADAEAIENIRVGDRVQTTQSSSVTAVDSSWRLVELEGVSSGELEESLHVRLLRSPASLEAHGVSESGDHVYLKLKELGFEGWLRVVGIQDAPEISSGPGRVVLSTFTRLSNDVYEVGFVGGAVLRGTGGHPLWSLDRDDWVSVRDLQVGERLQTAEGAVSVEALEKVRGEHRVYNLEVEGDHEYLVGEAGVRAHNQSACSGGGAGGGARPRVNLLNEPGLLFRVLRPEEAPLTQGLVAKLPGRGMSVEGFVRTGSRTRGQFIATSRSRVKSLFRARAEGRRVAVIDRRALELPPGVAGPSRIVDLTRPSVLNRFIGNPLTRRFAGASEEVLVVGRIRPEHILEVLFP